MADLSEEQIKLIVQETVKQTFISMGADTSTAQEVMEMQKDMAFLRSTRQGSQDFARITKRATIWTITGALFVALWQGFRFYLNQN